MIRDTYVIPRLLENEVTFAAITVEFSEAAIDAGLYGSSDELMEQIKEATTHWVKTCHTGKKAWEDSRGDLNIGDLANYSAYELSRFHEYLKNKGITIEDMNVYSMDTKPGVFHFDTVLVDSDKL